MPGRMGSGNVTGLMRTDFDMAGQAAAAQAAAQAYTDTKVAANSVTDQTYADSKDSVVAGNAATDATTKSAAAQAAAKTYTDTQTAAARSYSDTQLAAAVAAIGTPTRTTLTIKSPWTAVAGFTPKVVKNGAGLVSFVGRLNGTLLANTPMFQIPTGSLPTYAAGPFNFPATAGALTTINIAADGTVTGTLASTASYIDLANIPAYQADH